MANQNVQSNENTRIEPGDRGFGVQSGTGNVAGIPIHETWIRDVQNLGVGRVRLNVQWPYDPDKGETCFDTAGACTTSVGTLQAALRPMRDAVIKYRGSGREPAIEPLLVLTGSTLCTDANFKPEGTASCAGQNYIDAFGARAKLIASYVSSYVKCFQIWNEPNLDERIVDPKIFAKLIKTAAENIRQVIPDAVIITGAVNCSGYPTAVDPPAFVDAKQYIVDTMKELQKLEDEQVGPRKILFWNYIGVNIYFPRANGPSIPDYLRSINTDLAAGKIDPTRRSVWITEFGTERMFKTNPEGGHTNEAKPQEEQRDALRAWMRGTIAPSLAGRTISAAFWFTHDMETKARFHQATPDTPQRYGTFGLTDWDREDGHIEDSFHWLSWEAFRDFILSSSASLIRR